MNDADVALLDFAAPHQQQAFAAPVVAHQDADADVAAALPSSSGPTDLYQENNGNLASHDGASTVASTAHHHQEGGSSAEEVHTKGRMAESEAQIFSQTVRRLSRSRGGVFEMLSLLPGQQPGEPAQSLEGWVLIITGLPPECSEGDILDYFGRRAEIKNHRMNFDRRQSQCIGHAFVEYHTKEEAELVIADMDGQPFLTSDAIHVSPAFLVPELSAFEQLGRMPKRGRDAERIRGSDDADEAGAAAVENDEAEGEAVRGSRPEH